MSKINTDPNQSAMFIQGTINPKLEMPVDVEALAPTPVETGTEVTYPSVDIVEHAAELDRALVAIGKFNQGVGLQKAGGENSPLRSKIEQRYGSKTDQVVGGVQNTNPEKRAAAKRHFIKAMGMEAMIGSGLQTREEAEQFVDGQFTEFLKKYSPPVTGKAERDKMRGKLAKTQRSQARLRRNLS